MFFVFNIHKVILILFLLLFLNSCKLQEPYNNHGIVNLDKRADLIQVNKSNVNDVVKIIGQPHTISIENDKEWIYFERILSKGEFHKLGQNILKTNNVLILGFDKYGILKEKNFLDKNSKNNLKFSENSTTNDISQKSFVEKFLQSLKSKMYKR